MNSAGSDYKVLVIASTASEAASLAARIRAYDKNSFSIDEAQIAGGIDRVKWLSTAGKEPDVICLSGCGPSLRSAMQELGNLTPQSQVLLILDGHANGAIDQQLEHLPLSGLNWSLWCPDSSHAPQELEDACAVASKRRSYKSRLSRGVQRRDDIQSRQETERLPLSDYYLNHFLAQAQEAIVAIDTCGIARFWSGGANRLFNLQQDVIIGLSAEQLPFWSPVLQHAVAGVSSSSPVANIQTGYSHEGEELQLEITCSAVTDQSRNKVGTSLVIRDVTEREQKLVEERRRNKQQRAALVEERRRLLNLFTRAPGFIAVTEGPEHRFQITNKAYLHLLGRQSLLGLTAREALPELQGQEFLALFDYVYQQQTPYVGQRMPLVVQPDTATEPETRYLDFVFEPIIEDDGKVSGIFCQGSDVTEQKLAEDKLEQHRINLERLVQERTQELQSSQEALHRSQKLEAIGKLTGGVAHDFNNVLQIIASNLQLLELQLGQDHYDDSLDYIFNSLEAVNRGRNLSSQLLSFARRQPLQPMVANLAKHIRKMDHLLRRVLGEAVEVETVVAGGLWNTLVDPNQLENVILNLAINARDAMPEGGKLTLELGNAVLDERYVTSEPDVPPGQYVMLAVSDTGVGMPKEVAERIFEPFFTTKREGEGTGLGLSMAYGFTKQSGGHIRVYSEPGAGTTFRVYLPRSFEREEMPVHHSSGAVQGGSETILVVEDDEQVRRSVVLILENLGYQVLQAHDGASALNVLQSGVKVNLLFTDVVMPGRPKSPELAKKATCICPQIKVLFTSGYTQNAIVHGGRLDPGVELLGKPYSREELAQKVRAVLTAQPAADTEAFDTDVQPLQILLVEDEVDSRAAIRDLLKALGHEVRATESAEEALESLKTSTFDILLTDLSLPGISGADLIMQALKMDKRLRTIIASGYGEDSAAGLNCPTVWLAKPFGLDALKTALKSALKLPITT